MNQLRAGTAVRAITAAGVPVHDPLHARVLALDDGVTQAVLVVLDAVAIGGIGEVDDSFLPELRRRLDAAPGIDPRGVLVSATHTHPPGRLLCAPDELLERVAAAVAEAWARREPVVIGAGIGPESSGSINRTLRLRDGRQWTIRQAYPCPPDEEVASLGPLDPEIVVLRVDRPDGSPLAVLFNWACHPLLGVADSSVTANFPGVACRVIEEHLPGATALFVQGACGDVTELLYKDNLRPRDAEPVGLRLALSTLRAWRDAATGPADLALASATIGLPRRTDSEARIAELLAEQQRLLDGLRLCPLNARSFLALYPRYALEPTHPADYAYRYLHHAGGELRALDEQNRAAVAKYLSNLRAMEALSKLQDDLATLRRHQADHRAAGGADVPAEVTALRLGGCGLITCPAEPLTAIGLALKAVSPLRPTLVAGLTNGYLHYAAPAADYGLGGYETTECLLAPEWEERYLRAAARLLEQVARESEPR